MAVQLPAQPLGLLQFTRCSFTGNQANKDGLTGGGAARLIGGNVLFTDCMFSDNSATDFGGAVHLMGMQSAYFQNCSFKGNIAADGGHHLFVKSNKEGVKIENSVFDSSMTPDSSASDGEQVMIEVFETLIEFDACHFKSPKGGKRAIILKSDSPAQSLKIHHSIVYFSNGALLQVNSHLLQVQTSAFIGNGTIKVAKGTDAEVLVNHFDGVGFEFQEIWSESRVQFRNNRRAVVNVRHGNMSQCDNAGTGEAAG